MGTCVGEPAAKPAPATRVHPGQFRRVLGHLPTGVTVITAYTSKGPAGMAARLKGLTVAEELVGMREVERLTVENPRGLMEERASR